MTLNEIVAKAVGESPIPRNDYDNIAREAARLALEEAANVAYYHARRTRHSHYFPASRTQSELVETSPCALRIYWDLKKLSEIEP